MVGSIREEVKTIILSGVYLIKHQLCFLLSITYLNRFIILIFTHNLKHIIYQILL